MGALDNITFEGPNAEQLQSAYQYLYEHSTTFQTSLDNYTASEHSLPIVVTSASAVDLPGIENVTEDGMTNTAAGYNIIIDGTIVTVWR